MDQGEVPEAGLFPQSVGERLRTLRQSAKLDLHDVATRTRIPLRHLEAIERSDYAALPSPTYALGFTRSYARALGAEEAPLVSDLRAELGRDDPSLRGQAPYEPVDPTRVPSRLLAWTAAALALLLAVGYGIWRTQYYGADGDIAPVVEAPAQVAAPAPPRAVPPGAPVQTTGEVVLTASAPVWLRITDSGSRLFEKEMAVGERYVLPATAKDPRILTGRPDSLRVTVGGRDVAPLGPPEKTIKDVSLTAASLTARPAPLVAPSATDSAPAATGNTASPVPPAGQTR